MNWKYSDSDPLHTIEQGYNEKTRFLMFHSTPLEEETLQEALDIITAYNGFESKRVGKVLKEMFGDTVRYVVGREYSVVIYIIAKSPRMFWGEDLKKLQEAAVIDEVSVTNEGRLRLWWD